MAIPKITPAQVACRGTDGFAEPTAGLSAEFRSQQTQFYPK